MQRKIVHHFSRMWAQRCRVCRSARIRVPHTSAPPRVMAGPDERELALRACNLAVLALAPQTLLALGEMPCGADVEMTELNGVRGQVVEPQDPRTGLCGVKIDSDGRVLALKPANLVRLCGNAACRQALAPPLLQCSKCKAKAYCCQACQVGDPATHRAPCARARVCSLTRTRSRPPCRLSLPPDRRVEGRAQARVRRAGPRRRHELFMAY